MPASKEDCFRRHGFYGNHGARYGDPQDTNGDGATERWVWEDAIAMIRDILPRHVAVNDTQLLRMAIAVNQMQGNQRTRIQVMTDAEIQALMADGFVVRWHGTFPSALHGIVRYGLLPSFCASTVGRIRRYGKDLPQVYVAVHRECAIAYPMPIWSGGTMLGEMCCRDGTPPL